MRTYNQEELDRELLLSIEAGEERIVAHLLKKGANANAINANCDSALFIATSFSTTNKLTILKILIKAGADINLANNNRETPLIAAVKNSNLKIVKYLVENGASLEARNAQLKTPLLFAASKPNSAIIDYLAENKADLNALDEDRDTPLILASLFGVVENVRALINHGAKINIYNRNNQIALNSILFTGNIATKDRHEIIHLLIDAGSDLTHMDRDCDSFLMNSVMNVNVSSCPQLLHKDVDINYKNNHLKTALSYAASRNKTDHIKFFLEAGADINSADDEGNTPAMLAAGHRKQNALLIDSEDSRAEAFEVLLLAGADIHIKNNYGDTAASIAADEPQMLAILENFLILQSLKHNEITKPVVRKPGRI